MSVTILTGAQWGDEGKGKVVDFLAEQSDMVVRFQGGDNAGHTVVNDLGAFKLHIIPCGIFNKDCICFAGTGMVINAEELLIEIKDVESKGVSTENLYISGKAVMLMPYHITLDTLSEKGANNIGTTKRGIGFAYSDKVRRIALRYEDLLDMEYLKKRLNIIIPKVNSELIAAGGEAVDADDMYNLCVKYKDMLKNRIVEPVSFINKAIDAGKKILFEGQLGAMKDIDLGIYPYVTSSNPIAAYAAVSGGFSPLKIDNIVGVMKAFSSAVGNGPFPTEMEEEASRIFRGTGERIDDEFGARTGRARRLGWLDLVTVKYSTTVNGYTKMAICKIDKLDDMKEVKVCIGYKLDGKEIDYMPTSEQLYKVEPIYVTMQGWLSDTTKIRKYNDLPDNAKAYIEFIEKYINVPIAYVGVGPDRENTIIR